MYRSGGFIRLLVVVSVALLATFKAGNADSPLEFVLDYPALSPVIWNRL